MSSGEDQPSFAFSLRSSARWLVCSGKYTEPSLFKEFEIIIMILSLLNAKTASAAAANRNIQQLGSSAGWVVW